MWTVLYFPPEYAGCHRNANKLRCHILLVFAPQVKLEGALMRRPFPVPLSSLNMALKRAHAPFPRLQQLELEVDSQLFRSLLALPHLKRLTLRCQRLNRPLELTPLCHACPQLELLALHNCRQFNVLMHTPKFENLKKFEIRKGSRFMPPQLVMQLSRLLEILPEDLASLTLVGFRVPEGCVDYICEKFKKLLLCCINSFFDSNVRLTFVF